MRKESDRKAVTRGGVEWRGIPTESLRYGRSGEDSAGEQGPPSVLVCSAPKKNLVEVSNKKA